MTRGATPPEHASTRARPSPRWRVGGPVSRSRIRFTSGSSASRNAPPTNVSFVASSAERDACGHARVSRGGSNSSTPRARVAPRTSDEEGTCFVGCISDGRARRSRRWSFTPRRACTCATPRRWWRRIGDAAASREDSRRGAASRRDIAARGNSRARRRDARCGAPRGMRFTTGRTSSSSTGRIRNASRSSRGARVARLRSARRARSRRGDFARFDPSRRARRRTPRRRRSCATRSAANANERRRRGASWRRSGASPTDSRVSSRGYRRRRRISPRRWRRATRKSPNCSRRETSCTGGWDERASTPPPSPRRHSRRRRRKVNRGAYRRRNVERKVDADPRPRVTRDASSSGKAPSRPKATWRSRRMTSRRMTTPTNRTRSRPPRC